MSYIEWAECQKVGHRFMDHDHEHMVSCLNQLVEALVGELHEQSGMSRHQAIDSAMARLLAVTEAHFRHEEAAMAMHGYPDQETHKAQHDLLLQQLRAAATPQQFPLTGASVQFTIRFWREWYEAHIENYDAALAGWLLEHSAQ